MNLTQLRCPFDTCSLQFLEQRLPIKAVHHLHFSQPALTRDARAQTQETRVFIAVRIGIDDAFHPFAFGIRPVPPVQIKAVRIAIQFDPGPGRRARINHRVDVDRIRLALQKQT